MNFTSCSNTSNITETIEEYLQQLQDKTNVTMIPAVTLLCIFSVVGLAGNSLVLIVHSKKQGINATKVLIIAIASFHLVANVAAIPMVIYTMFDTWHFRIAVVCKVTASLGCFTVLGGAICLLIVAYIRYRKVCKPYGWQVTSQQAKISSLVAFLLAAVFSIPYFIIYGVRTRQTPCPNIRGSECFAADYYFNTIWPLLNSVFLVTVYLSMSITLVALYVFVGKAARLHRKRHGVSEYTTQASSDGQSTAAANTSDLSSINTSATRATNMESAPRGIFQVLLCCRSHPEEQKSLGDTQSSMDPKMSTTSFGKNDKPNLQTDNNERSLSNDKLLNSHRLDNAPHTMKHQSGSNQAIEVRKHDLGFKNSALSNEHTREPLHQIKRQTTSGTSGRMTLTLMIISSIYVLGFLPFLILTIFKIELPEKYSNMNMIEQTFCNLFYRLYFLNSAAFPVIYILCNMNIKRDCINIVTGTYRTGFIINT